MEMANARLARLADLVRDADHAWSKGSEEWLRGILQDIAEEAVSLLTDGEIVKAGPAPGIYQHAKRAG